MLCERRVGATALPDIYRDDGNIIGVCRDIIGFFPDIIGFHRDIVGVRRGLSGRAGNGRIGNVPRENIDLGLGRPSAAFPWKSPSRLLSPKRDFPTMSAASSRPGTHP
jgi:hypothetical protein